MLYYLFQWLDKYDFPGAGMFGYTSFRALMAIILALLISSIWGDKFIDLLKRKQITETQRDANIDPFGVNKVGVPSMGGVIIIFAILIPCLLLGKLNNIYMILMLITTVWLGSLGFADDYIKIFKKDKEGLHGKFKIIGQVGLGLIVGITLYLSPQVVIRENIEVEKPGQGIEVVHAAKEIKATQTTIPFFKSNNLDYADLVSFMGEHAQTAGWILFVLVTIFVVILRPGWITKETMEDFLGCEVLMNTSLKASDHGVPRAPGMKYKHYAPKAEMVLVLGEDQEKVVNYINKLAKEQKKKGKKIGIIASDETKDLYQADEVVSVGQRAHLETVTAHLYDVLREFDHKDVDMIYSEGFEGEPLSEAIMNRMVKAAGHEILRI